MAASGARFEVLAAHFVLGGSVARSPGTLEAFSGYDHFIFTTAAGQGPRVIEPARRNRRPARSSIGE